MEKEIDALERNQTWEIVDLSYGNKWVYKLKFSSDETLERHKTRLVAKVLLKFKGLIFMKHFLQ